MTDPTDALGDTLRLVGGPNDGDQLHVVGYLDRWHVPRTADVSLDPKPTVSVHGVYEARRDPSSGRRSRADDGAVLLDWKGWA